jgi:hypothetical protein
MDENTSVELRMALDFLKAGDAAKARPILVRILKEDPEIEQAWYMLSFVVSDFTKQKYALEQVLRINPNHPKAQARLDKLSGDIGDPSFAEETRENYPSQADAATKDETPAASAKGDLLSRRMDAIGARLVDETEKTSDRDQPAESAKPIKQSRKKPKKEKKRKKKKAKPQTYSTDPFSFVEETTKKPRWRIWILVIALVVLIALVFVVFGGGGVIGDLLSGPGGGDSISPPVQTTPATPTLDGGGRQLPPTWTPTPTDVPTATPPATAIPTATDIPTS